MRMQLAAARVLGNDVVK